MSVDEQTVSAVLIDRSGEVRARSGRQALGPDYGGLRAALGSVAGAAGTPPSAAALAASNTDAVVAEVVRLMPPGVSVVTLAPGAAAVVAEHWLGAARGARHAVTLSVGASVEAGLLINGQPWLGAHGLAGSAGWLALNPVEREDYRRSGCLEAEVGTAGIVRRLVWRVKAGDRSQVTDAVGDDLTAVTAEAVFVGARQGDGVAISVVRDTAKYVGMAVANLVAAVDPEIVVLGGMLATHADLLLDPVRAEVGRRASARQSEEVTIVASSLGDDAAAMGAARYVMMGAR